MNDAEDGDAAAAADPAPVFGEEQLRRRLRPELRRLLELGPESYGEYVKEKLEREIGNDTGPLSLGGPPPSDMALDTMETLLSSRLVRLSPPEERCTRRGRYPIFKDNAGDMFRESYLFDEIPFAVEDPLDRRALGGSYDVYHHEERIDWGALEGWDVPPDLRAYDRGILIVGRTERDRSYLEGRLIFMPDDNFEEDDACCGSEQSILSSCDDSRASADSDDSNEGEEELDDSEGDESIDEPDYDGEEGGEDGDEDQSEHSEQSSIFEVDDFSEGEEERSDDSEDESLDEPNLSGEEEDDESEVTSQSEESDISSEGWKDRLYEKVYARFMENTLLHFDESRLTRDSDYENSSWSASNGECGFGLIGSPRGDEGDGVDGVDGSVTLFRANESMAFARGDKQDFVSLEDPSNYGIECGSHHVHDRRSPYRDDSRRARVLRRMRAYRNSSWICRLCPAGMTVPEGVAGLIGEFWRTGPPPFLFVTRGDLLLLARYKETIPDPDYPDMLGAGVTREHLVLARASSKDEE